MEPKGATLSVHARGARDPEAARLLLAQVASEALDRGLVPTPGREVLEVRPPVSVDKGTAVRALLRGHRRARRASTSATTAPTPTPGAPCARCATEGRSTRRSASRWPAGEVAPAVREAADVEVPGPPGALEVLRFLAQ